MSITRAQIPEEIDIFQDGGAAQSSAMTSYYDQLKDLYKDPINPSMDDINKRAQELSFLVQQPRRGNLYDLATALSKGLAQQALSGRPSSVGYGLALGFNLFTEAEQQKREAAEAMKQKLMMMAYEDVQGRMEQSRQLQREMLDADFKYRIEEMKNRGGMFDSKTVAAQAWNFVLEAEKNPELKKTPQYRVARAILKKPRRSFQQTEQGTVQIEQPGYDLDSVLPDEVAPAEAGEPQVPPGYTPTGKYKDGKMIYQRINEQGVVEYGTF